MFEDSIILVTGGTGSFGNKFIPMTLKKFNPKKLIVFLVMNSNSGKCQKNLKVIKGLDFL